MPTPTEVIKRYVRSGAASQLFRCVAPEVVLAGPAGTGKSRACLERLHKLALDYPGMRGLMVRRTRKALTQSAMVTFREKVLHPLDNVTFRATDQEYRYGNGSVIVVAGLDDPAKVMSAEYDIAYVQEGTEVTEHAWESLTARLRNGVVPFQQIMGDCNPDAPTHWLKRRVDRGATVMLESRHEDNPSVTAQYLAVLDALTGVRYLRLRKGIWAAAEGLVYDDWNTAVHLTDRFDIPPSWRKLRVIDFGYTNPFVCYDDQTEILTAQGWMNFADLPEGLAVASIHPESHRLEWQTPTAFIEQWYDGPMITAEPAAQGANFSVTPNHRMAITNRKSGHWRFEAAARLWELGDSAIPTGWEARADLDGDQIVQHTRTNNRGRTSTFTATRLIVARFLGLWLAEGCLTEQRVVASGDVRRYVRIAQKHDTEAVRMILRDLDVPWTETANATGVIDFRVQHAALYEYLHDLCGKVLSAEKRIPGAILGWGADSLRALLGGLILGDGRHQIHDADGRRIGTDAFFTTSKGLADDVQALACRLGLPTVIVATLRATPFLPGGSVVYAVRFHQARQAKIDKLPLRETEYHGYIRCVTVPNGMLVVRRGGRPMVCGNCQWWAIDGDSRMYLYRELYMTQRTVDEHATQIINLSKGETYIATVADHDAEDRATLAKRGIVTIPAYKAVSRGIQAVQGRLRPAGDGRPRLFFLRDSLIERDERLSEMKKPCCTAEEFDGYVWPKGQDGRALKEEPVKEDDHGMDACRYAVASRDLIPRTNAPAIAGSRPAIVIR